jgi:hypothetical protein
MFEKRKFIGINEIKMEARLGSDPSPSRLTDVCNYQLAREPFFCL